MARRPVLALISAGVIGVRCDALPVDMHSVAPRYRPLGSLGGPLALVQVSPSLKLATSQCDGWGCAWWTSSHSRKYGLGVCVFNSLFSFWQSSLATYKQQVI